MARRKSVVGLPKIYLQLSIDDTISGLLVIRGRKTERFRVWDMNHRLIPEAELVLTFVLAASQAGAMYRARLLDTLWKTLPHFKELAHDETLTMDKPDMPDRNR